MLIFIPKLGTKITLLRSWQFQLHCEERNKTLWNLQACAPFETIGWYARRGNFCTVTLQPGDKLKVDRIFVRKGSEAYDSVTFRGEVKYEGVIRKVRFWVELKDANNVDGEITYA